MSAPAPVLVARWGELPADRKLPGVVLRVLVDGQHAGAVALEDGSWQAVHQARVLGPYRQTSHPSAGEAVAAVLRSGFARRLGARAASPLHWSGRARQAARWQV